MSDQVPSSGIPNVAGTFTSMHITGNLQVDGGATVNGTMGANVFALAGSHVPTTPGTIQNGIFYGFNIYAITGTTDDFSVFGADGAYIVHTPTGTHDVTFAGNVKISGKTQLQTQTDEIALNVLGSTVDDSAFIQLTDHTGATVTAQFGYQGGILNVLNRQGAIFIEPANGGGLVDGVQVDGTSVATNTRMLLYTVDTGSVQRVKTITNAAVLTLLGMGAGRLLYVSA